MKKLLLIFALFCASYMTVNAQTNTWTGNADNNWSNVANWSLNAVPTASHDVVIPTGKTVNLNVAGTTKSIAVQGNSTFNMSNNLSILNASSIAANATVAWVAGNLTGGGALTNNGTFNLSSANTKSITDVTTFNNFGNFNMLDGGDFNITDGVFNNLVTGVIDMRGEEGNISYTGTASRILNNTGLIKRTTAGNARIQTILNNNGGTITVSNGNLIFDFLDKNLTAGTYNVSAGSVLQWTAPTNVSGILTGVLTGDLAWTGDVSVAASATFNFTGSSGVSWAFGNLTGGGTLVNKNLIFLSTGNTKSIIGMTTLNNEGDFNILDGGDFNITDGVFNNLASGVIDMQGVEGNITFTGSASRVLNNVGLIKRTSTGNARIQTVLNNNGGTISVSSGNLIFDTLDKNLNGGTYNVSDQSSLQWNSNTVVSGTLTGNLTGDIAWSNDVTVPIATIATFDFTGSSGVSWISGNLTGGGTLVNKNLIFLSTGSTKSIIGMTTLNNEGDFNILDGGDFNITDGVFNNLASGVIDMQGVEGNITFTGSASRVLNNVGLIKRTSTGNARIQTVLNNNGGTISVSSGNLIFDTLDKNLNGGIYNVSDQSSLQWNSNTVVSGTLTGNLTGEIAWSNDVTVPIATIATFNFAGNSGVRWISGNLAGGGTLINENLIFLSSGNTKSIIGLSTMNNEGDFNILDGGDFNITDGVFNNLVTGVIDMQGVEGNISYTGSASRILNNTGLIKRTTAGNARIQTILNNNGGTITVSSGNLIFDFLDKNLTAGIYNVSAGSVLQWTAPTNVSGTLTGALNGDLAWTGDVSVVASGTFDFTGNSGVSWSFGNLTGGGTLSNKSLIFLSSGNTKSIVGMTTLSNEGDFNITDGGDFNITDGVFNNQLTGIIDLQGVEGNISYTGSASRILNNFGLIKRTTAGNARIQTILNNSGLIDAQSGNLIFSEFLSFANGEEGIVKGVATVTIANTANYTNNGTFAPGGSPGILNFNGIFKSSATSVLDVELNGLTSGTQYDVLAITGTNVVFNGGVNVTLGFAPSLNNEFIVATTTGTISQCSLATTTSANFNGMTYIFDVFCRNNNQVVLKVTNVTLGVDDVDFSESSIKLYPNPVRGMLTIKNTNNLELDNGEIMDVTGKVLTTFDLRDMGLTKEISLENYASGLYFVKINGLNSSITKQVIKQ